MNKPNGPLILFFFLIVATFMLPCQQAQATLYPYISGDNSHEWITNVSFGTINNSSAQNSKGYGDYTYDKAGIMTRLNPGSSYTLKVTIHPDTTWCDEYIYAFFDWNHDGDFTDAGEEVKIASDTCVAGPHSAKVVVPTNAGGEEVRMRVVLKYFDPPTSFGNIPEGEAEDYTIVVNSPAITGDNRSEWITNVTINSINNSSGPNYAGYGDYSFWVTGKTAAITRGEKYPLSVTISPDTNWCDENVTAFIDWNHDGDFFDAKEKNSIAWKTCTPGPHILNMSVPHDAKLGKTSMRIVLRWLYTPTISGYISGEAEDYTLFVQEKKSPWILFIPAIVGHK